VLKQRLEATENALLRLLLAADEETIVAAFGNGSAFMEDPSRLASTISPDMPGGVEVKKAALVAHWDQFPLRTAEEVRCWAKEILRSPAVASSENSRGTNAIILPEPESNQRVDSSYSYSQQMQMAVDGRMSVSEVRIDDIERDGHGRPPGPDHEAVVPYLDQQSQASADLQHLYMSTKSNLKFQEKEESLELSQEFRQQYLW
jgi:hypothetical protein